jgi:L-iditol 2-dehydrogenase
MLICKSTLRGRLIKMKALVKFASGFGNLEMREVDEPEIGSTDVLVKVKSAGLCGSDMAIFRGEFQTVLPVIVGHEFSGEVVKAGRDVGNISLGDRIVSETAAEICGKCFFCRTGRYNLCPDRKGFGYGIDGAFAEYIKVPSRTLHCISHGVTFDEAALCEPLSVATRSTKAISNVQLGDTVAVIGPGPIGLLIVQVAKASGASSVISIGAQGDDSRLELARKLGADDTVNVSKENPVEKMRLLTAGKMPDIVIEAAGTPGAALLSCELVRSGGIVTLVGVYSETAEMNLNLVVRKEVQLRGNWTSGVYADWKLALKMLSEGRVQTAPLITHRLPMQEWAKAFKLAEKREAIKVIFNP